MAEAGWRYYQAEFTEAACVERYLDLLQRRLVGRRGAQTAVN